MAIIFGQNIKLVAESSIPLDGQYRPILALFPTKEFLTRLDEIPEISEMMVISSDPHEMISERVDQACYPTGDWN